MTVAVLLLLCACALCLCLLCKGETAKGQRTHIEPTAKAHRNCIQRATNVHPTSLTIQDNHGLLATMSDNDDSAREGPRRRIENAVAGAGPGLYDEEKGRRTGDPA